MKFIDLPVLSHLARTLTHDSPECTVHTRIEAYSCKSITKEKRLFKALEHSYSEDLAHSASPPNDMAREPEMTAFGPMDKHSSRKTLYLLIATLNACFPDHDFSDLRPDNFSREESGARVLNALSATLLQLRNRPNAVGDVAPRTYSSYPPIPSELFPSSLPTSSSPTNTFRMPQPPIVSGTHPALYKMLDDIIGLAECDVFSYSPELESDPHGGDSDSDVSSDATSSDDEDTFDFEPDEDPDGPAWHRGTARRGWSRDSTASSPESSLARSANADSLWTSLDGNRARRPRGALLWSSHWFFHNRKLKRILFVSVWARKKTGVGMWALEDGSPSERFVGWDGAAGAGARALGLPSMLAAKRAAVHG